MEIMIWFENLNEKNGFFCVCFDVMYSSEYNVFDVTLLVSISVYPPRAG